MAPKKESAVRKGADSKKGQNTKRRESMLPPVGGKVTLPVPRPESRSASTSTSATSGSLPPQDKLDWLLQQLSEDRHAEQRREVHAVFIDHCDHEVSVKAPLPPIAPKPVEMELDAVEKLFNLTFVSDCPPEDEAAIIQNYHRAVGSRDLARQAITLHQLGLHNLTAAKEKQPPNPQDFINACIILNCAYMRCSFDKQRRLLIKHLEEVEKRFLERFAGIKPILHVYKFYTEEEGEEIDESLPIYDPSYRHRENLKDIRRESERFSLKCQNLWSTLLDKRPNSDDYKMEENEILLTLEKSASALSLAMKELVKDIVLECVKVLGNPPCTYAVVGVGDIAINQITPYSDIEYVILVAEEHPKVLKYFENLSHLLELKVIGLGETPLTCADICLYQDFYNKTIKQFCDAVTPDGVKIDDRFPSVTPFSCVKELPGVDSSYNLSFIKSPKEMAKFASFLQRKHFSKEALKLYQPLFINGDQELYTNFISAMENHFSAVNLFDDDKPKHLALGVLEDIRDSISMKTDFNRTENRIQLDNLRREVVSVPFILYALRLVYRCPFKPLPQFLDDLKKQNVIEADEDGKNVRMLLGLSYFLQLCQSLHKRSKHWGMGVLSESPLVQDITALNIGLNIFGFEVYSMLQRFYCSFVPLWQTMITFVDTQDKAVLTPLIVFDNSSYVKRMALYELNHFQDSIESAKDYIALLKKNTTLNSEQMWQIYTELGYTAIQASNSVLGKALFTRAMEVKEGISDHEKKLIAFVHTWHNLGLTALIKDDPTKAKEHFEESISIIQDSDSDFLKSPSGKAFLYLVHKSLALCNCALGLNSNALSFYNKSLQYLEESSFKPKLEQHRMILFDIAACQFQLTRHKDCLATLKKLFAMNLKIDGLHCPSVQMTRSLRLMSRLMKAMGKAKQAQQYGSAAYNNMCKVLDPNSAWLQPRKNACYQDSCSIVPAIREYAECASCVDAHDAAIQAMQLVLNNKGLFRRQGTNKGVSLQQAMDHKRIGQMQLRHEKPLKAYDSFQKCLEILLKVFGKKQNLHMAHAHCEIGCALNTMGKHENALDSFTVALLQAETCLSDGQPHEIIADIYEQMAEANHHLHRLEKASTFFEECITMRRHLYGDIHPVIANSLKNQGLIFHQIDQPEKALHYLEQAVQMTQVLQGHKAKSAEVAKLIHTIAVVYEKVNNFGKSEENYKASLDMYKEVYGKDVAEDEVITLLDNFGHMYRNAQEVPKAITYHKQCLEMMRKVHGTENLKVARLLAVIATHYQSCQLYMDTVKIYENAIEIHRRVKGHSNDGQEVSDWLINLAKCYEVIGEKEKASECHSRALEINQSSDCQDVAARDMFLSLKRLAETAETKRLYEQALMLWKQALGQATKLYGEDTPHPDTVTALEAIAINFLKVLDYDKALDFNNSLLIMLKELHIKDQDQPQTALALSRAGVINEAVGRVVDAILHYRNALAMLKRIYRNNDINTAVCLAKLGHALDLVGEGTEAVLHLKESIAMITNLKRNKGPHMEQYCLTLFHLGLALETHPNFEQALEVHENAFYAWKEFLTLEDEKKTSRIPVHVQIADCYQAMGRVQVVLQNYSDAVKCLENHIELRDKLHGKKRVLIEYTHYFTELGLAYSAGGKTEEGVLQFSNALRIMRQLYGKTKPQLHVAKCLWYLASSYRDLGINSKALELAKESLEMYENLLQHDCTEHANYVTITSFLGDMCMQLGKPRTALKHFQKALQYYMNMHGDNSFAADVETAMKNLKEAKEAVELAKEERRAAAEEKLNKRRAKMAAKVSVVTDLTQGV